MISLTRSYKKAETRAFRQAAARLSALASRATGLAKGLARKARQGITILVVDDSTKAPRGVRISYLALALSFSGILGILGLTFLFSLGAESARRAGGGKELAAARLELDRLKEGAAALARSYADLSRPLQAIAATIQRPQGRAGIDPVRRPGALAAAGPSRFRGESRRIAEASAGLEAAIGPLEELGMAAAAMGEIRAAVPALWPIKGSLGHLSATYGPNPNPFTGEPYFHTGIDCSTYREGDSLVATADGVVVFAGLYYGYGRSVVLDHPNGYFTRFGHLQRILVRDGQKVMQGQVIGILGNTGNSTGPHAHYEVFIGNTRVDPIDYLWAAEDRKAPEGTVPFGMEN